MKNYTEPKLEIVTFEASDVITTSGPNYGDLFRSVTGGNEHTGRASLNQYRI